MGVNASHERNVLTKGAELIKSVHSNKINKINKQKKILMLASGRHLKPTTVVINNLVFILVPKDQRIMHNAIKTTFL